MYVSFGKRVCDIVVGLVALPFVLLIIAVLAPFIHFEDKGPVFYNAPRVGKRRARFQDVQAALDAGERARPHHGGRLHLQRRRRPAHDAVGAFMRKTPLDEMPQFLNVLKGDMSVVGPAPTCAAKRSFTRESKASNSP